MQVTDLLDQKLIRMNIGSREKWGAVSELADLLFKDDRISSLDLFMDAVKAREEQVCTGIGAGIAIPHAISVAVKISSIVFGRSQNGIDYGSIDGGLVHLVFLFAIPKSYTDKEYLRTLSSLARLLVHDSVIENLNKAKTLEDVIDALH